METVPYKMMIYHDLLHDINNPITAINGHPLTHCGHPLAGSDQVNVRTLRTLITLYLQ